jgi:hypothetical protein
VTEVAATNMALLVVENLRHLDVIAIPAGDIFHKVFKGHGRSDLVCAHYASGIGGFASWRHVGSIHFVEEVEIVDDRGELVAECQGFFFPDTQTNQEGNMFDHAGIDGGGWCEVLIRHFVDSRKKREVSREQRVES